MFFIGFSKHLSLFIAEEFVGVDTSESVIWVSIDVGEEILPPAGMLESAG